MSDSLFSNFFSVKKHATVRLLILVVAATCAACDPLPLGDEARTRINRIKIQKVTSVVNGYELRRGLEPERITDLSVWSESRDPRCEACCDYFALLDAWQRPFELRIGERRRELVSFGADGVSGGTGPSKDLIRTLY
jgi:hypothetical protein